MRTAQEAVPKPANPGIRRDQGARGRGDVDAETVRNPHAPTGFRAARGQMRSGATQAMPLYLVKERQRGRCRRAARNAASLYSWTAPRKVNASLAFSLCSEYIETRFQLLTSFVFGGIVVRGGWPLDCINLRDEIKSSPKAGDWFGD